MGLSSSMTRFSFDRACKWMYLIEYVVGMKWDRMDPSEFPHHNNICGYLRNLLSGDKVNSRFEVVKEAPEWIEDILDSLKSGNLYVQRFVCLIRLFSRSYFYIPYFRIFNVISSWSIVRLNYPLNVIILTIINASRALKSRDYRMTRELISRESFESSKIKLAAGSELVKSTRESILNRLVDISDRFKSDNGINLMIGLTDFTKIYIRRFTRVEYLLSCSFWI
jgi:hypothetical protein